ncbi:DUF262 domain-containing protein [Paenibacillus taichungensis]|uniref:DUF262 domain-containing protein n=1 Tax=Paenibacillus taichungensis TaxID=484184 RepID=UPI0038D24BE9
MSTHLSNEVEPITLYSLLERFEIRIPIIQRDYAQGRYNVKANEVRRRLLDDIIRTCNTNEQLDFNFVYGNESRGIFYPVDGQQRLTTLYLLHWFLSCRIGADQLNQFNRLNKFSYMTRNSASEFFELLRSPASELFELIQSTGNLRERITDYAWFRAEWDHDPTVISSLNMLNDMCQREEFRGSERFFLNQLLSKEKPAIYFRVLVEKGKNTDSVETAAAVRYIRMNARGKVLTTFENVKAMLDGIDEKLHESSTSIISDFDTEFIDIFYSKSSGNLVDKAKFIDMHAMYFFRNMYNIAALIHDKETFDDDIKYANAMYGYCHGNLTSSTKAFFIFYFNMMEAVLRARKSSVNMEEFIDSVFENNFLHSSNSKQHVAYYLYLYCLYSNYMRKSQTEEHRKNFSVSVSLLKVFDYVLRNLNYKCWNDKAFTAIHRLANKTSETHDIMEYFQMNNPETIFVELKSVTEITDLRQRVIEQHIKANIILHKGCSYDWFRILEERFSHHKIQYLLWISGLWSDQVTADFHCNEAKLIVLDIYMEIALQYFYCSDNKKDLIWRKLFAIGGNWNESQDKLYDSETINAKTNVYWEKHCFWDDCSYFWNDNMQPDEEKLNIVRRTYDLISKYKEKELFALVSRHLDDTCWLAYAVAKDHKELLTNTIWMDSSGKLRIRVNNYGRSFMLYMLMLERGYKTNNYQSPPYLLDSNESFSGFGLCRIKDYLGTMTLTFESNKTYQHSNGELMHREWRKYNLTLQGQANIYFDGVSINEEDTVYFVNKDIFEVYQYREESRDFSHHFYNLSKIRSDTKICSLKLEQSLKDINEEYTNRNYDTVLKIKNNSHELWHPSNGNSRTWYQIEELGYQFDKGAPYKIKLNSPS